MQIVKGLQSGAVGATVKQAALAVLGVVRAFSILLFLILCVWLTQVCVLTLHCLVVFPLFRQ